MKKTLSILLAAATLLAACTKSEIAYEQPQEIGFNVVANNLTKSAVVDNNYDTDLDMIVSAWNDNAATTEVEHVEYFINETFGYKQVVTLDGPTKNAWGGKDEPQYWPNVNTLCFMGISASTKVSANNVVMYPIANGTNAANTIAISSYTQPEPAADNNNIDDLMWFPLTSFYGKNTVAVPVTMYHALSLLKFQVQGDEVTGVNESSYKVTNITINNLNKQGNVVLGSANHSATWKLSTTETKSSLLVYNNTAGTSLSGTCTVDETTGAINSQSPKVAENIENGILVLPQTPTTIDLTYEYTSSAGKTISETVKGLLLTLTDGTSWDDGYKYIYTITIKANEILIAPTPETWVDGTAGTVTIE